MKTFILALVSGLLLITNNLLAQSISKTVYFNNPGIQYTRTTTSTYGNGWQYWYGCQSFDDWDNRDYYDWYSEDNDCDDNRNCYDRDDYYRYNQNSNRHYTRNYSYYYPNRNYQYYPNYNYRDDRNYYRNRRYAQMSPRDFLAAKKTIANQSFSETKLKIAEQILKTNYMSSEQIRQIMLLFSFESTRLAFAKFGYEHTIDPQNYYTVYNAFSFSSSVDELNTFISLHPYQRRY